MRPKNATAPSTKSMMRTALKSPQVKDSDYYRLRQRESTSTMLKHWLRLCGEFQTVLILDKMLLRIKDIAEANGWSFEEYVSLIVSHNKGLIRRLQYGN